MTDMPDPKKPRVTTDQHKKWMEEIRKQYGPKSAGAAKPKVKKPKKPAKP